MGYRGTTSTILRFGENDACEGELIGEANRGLTYMFQMMNEARIGVGLGAAMLAHAGYVHSLDYARNRPQGRHPGGKDPAAPPVAIIEHADVKRMLLAQRAYAEGGMALCLHAAKLMDDERTAPPKQAANASLLLDVLTPICKAWPSEWGPRANDLAIQIMGGYGYTRDYPVEQYYRDNRLNPIHEGTNGIQALDLLGRKLAMSDGRGLDLLAEEIRSTGATASDDEVLRPHADALATHLDAVVHTSALLLARMQAGDVNLALANASLHLDAMGQVVIAWQWLRQAIVAQRMLDAGNGDPDYLQGKVQVCHYFCRYELPRVNQLTELLNQIDTTCADTPASWF
jgi:butyryl-CoA dehydrogenase